MVNFSTALTLLLALNGVSGIRHAREKQGKRQLSTKGFKCPKSTTLQETVTCKQTISGPATLERNLYCQGLGDDEAAITLDGPTATLDCAGKAVIGDCTGDPVSCLKDSIGIRLRNGATAVNCISTKFDDGFRLDGDGDNQVIDSTASMNGGDGIEIRTSSGTQLILRSRVFGNAIGIYNNSTSTSMSEVKETITAGNRFDGIQHETNTSMLILDSASFGNNDGIDIFGGTVQVENTNVFDNQQVGISVSYGTVTLRNVESSFSGDNNIEASDGPNGATGKVNIKEGVYACGATGDDVEEDSGGDVDTTVAQPVCVNGTTFAECMEGCDQPGNASALVCV